MREEKNGNEWDNDCKLKHTSYSNVLRRPGIHGDQRWAMPTAKKASEYWIFESATPENWKVQIDRWNFGKRSASFPPRFEISSPDINVEPS